MDKGLEKGLGKEHALTDPLASFDPALSFEAMEEASKPGFDAWFLAAAQRFAAVEEVYAYRYTQTGGPKALVSTGDEAASKRAALYAKRYHPYDPMLRGKPRSGNAAFFHVEARQIDNREYRHHCFEAPRFVDKLSFLWRRRQANGLYEAFYVSFYRREAGQSDELGALAKLADAGLSSLARQSKTQQQAIPLVSRLERQVASAYPALTQRESSVCARTLAGDSADDIAEALGIAKSSVLTYRQRAYAKYGFTSAAGFLDKLI